MSTLSVATIACALPGPRPPSSTRQLQILGISVTRIKLAAQRGKTLQDLSSAELMISNERIRAINAAMLIEFRDL
jgi:hypothetical protein